MDIGQITKNVCSSCGNQSWDFNSEDCTYCQLEHSTSIQPSDVRFIIFLAAIERLKAHLTDDEILRFEPTDREFEYLNEGDQIVDLPVIWRIVGKQGGLSSAQRSMWIELRSIAGLSTQAGELFVNRLPPLLSNQLLQIVDKEMVRLLHYLPLFLNKPNELLAVGFGSEQNRTEFRRVLSEYKITFCRTTKSAFQQAFRAYYADYRPRGCTSYQQECSKQWSDLSPTDSLDCRFCEICARRVFVFDDNADLKPALSCQLVIAKHTDIGINRPTAIQPGEGTAEGIDDPFKLYEAP